MTTVAPHVLAIVLAFESRVMAQEGPKEPVSDALALAKNYDLTVQTDKRTYSAGENIQVIELLVNHGTESRIANYNPQWYRCIVKRDGKIVNLTPASNPGYSRKLALLSGSRFTRLIEGEKGVKGSYNLNEIADVSRPGHYTIEASRTFPDKMYQPDPAKMGELTAKVEIDIAPSRK